MNTNELQASAELLNVLADDLIIAGEVRLPFERRVALRGAIRTVLGLLAKLPKTADGVPVVPHATVWVLRPGDGAVFEKLVHDIACPDSFYSRDPVGWSNVYSTRVAAEAARKDGG